MMERKIRRIRRADNDEKAPSADRYRRDDREEYEREDEDEPRGRRRRSRDDDDEPRGRRSRDDEDEPRGRRRSRDDDDGDDDKRSGLRRRPTGGRRRSRDDDDDDEPAEKPKGSVRSGWAGFKENVAKSSNFADELKLSDEEELVWFIDEGPFASFRQHWIERQGKKSFTCMEDDCPLCDIGDDPRTLAVFNVLHLNAGGDPVNKVLMLGIKAAKQLEGIAAKKSTSPLNRDDLYFALSRTGKKSQTSYNFLPIKARDLYDEWKIEPLSDKEMDDAEANAYDEEVIQRHSRKELREIARDATEDD